MSQAPDPLDARAIHRAVVEFARLAWTVEAQLGQTEPTSAMLKDRKVLTDRVSHRVQHQRDPALAKVGPHTVRRRDFLVASAVDAITSALDDFKAGRRTGDEVIDAVCDICTERGVDMTRKRALAIVRTKGRHSLPEHEAPPTADVLVRQWRAAEPKGSAAAAKRFVSACFGRSSSSARHATDARRESGADSGVELEALKRGSVSGPLPPLTYLLTDVLGYPRERVTHAIRCLESGRTEVERVPYQDYSETEGEQ